MQLALSFSVLLATLLLVLSVEALPGKRGAGRITLPLKRVEQKRDGVHPLIYMLRHVNRGERRLARMNGRAPAPDHELRARIHRRMEMIEEEQLARRFNRENLSVPQSKRYNRIGTGGLASVAKVNKVGAASGGLGGLIKGIAASKGKAKGTGMKGTSAGAAASGGAIGGVAGAGAAANGKGVGKGGAASDGQTAGVNPIDIKALGDPSLLTPAGNPTADNSVGLDIESRDTGYIATIQMGTPAQDFRILMDSGSSDFWVGNAEQCQNSDTGANNCGNHQFLGTSTSSSFKDSNQQFEVTYGTGAVQGNLCQDDVSMGGLTLKAHTFGTAQVETDDFASDDTSFDGLMGLAQGTLSQQQVPTPVESLAQAGQLNGAITAFKISRLSDQKNDGEVTFGDVDPTKFQQNTLVSFKNVNQNGFWEGGMDAVAVDGQDLGLQGRTAILDTGTTLIQAPQADAAAVHQAIAGAKSAGQGMFTIPCTSNATVALSFGGASFAINPADLAFAPVDQKNPDPTGDCLSGIGANSVNPDDPQAAQQWLVGDVFLKNAYFVTDEDKQQISLAQLA